MVSLRAEHAPFPFSVFTGHVLQFPHHTGGLPTHTMSFPALGVKTLHIWSNDCCRKGGHHFPQSASCAFVNSSWDTVGCLCFQDIQLLPTKTPPAGPLPSQTLISLRCCCQGFFLSRYTTWHLGLNFSGFEWH